MSLLSPYFGPMADPNQPGMVQGSGAPPGYVAPTGLVNNAGEPLPGNPSYGGGMTQGSGATPSDPSFGISTIGQIPQAQQILMQQGLPPGAPGGGQAGSGAPSNYQAAQAYNADPYGNGGYGPSFLYDPSGGMGYGGASPGGGPGSYGGYGMAGAGYGGVGSYGGGGGGNYAGVDAGSAGVLGAGMSAMGQVGAAQASAQPGIISANNAPGIQAGINTSNQAVAGINAAPNLLSAQNQIPLANIAQQTALGTTGLQTDAQKYAAQLGLQGQLGVSGNQLTGTLAGIANQVPLQNAANTVGLAQNQTAQDKLAMQQHMFDQLLGSGVLGGATGGGSGGGTSGGTGAGGNGPPLPQSQVVNPLLLQQSINQSQNAIAKRYGGLQQQQLQGLAQRGFNTTGGLPPALAMQDMANESPELTNAALQWNLGAAGQNAGQSNNVAQMGLTQYNAAADRALRMQLAAMGLLGNFAA